MIENYLDYMFLRKEEPIVSEIKFLREYNRNSNLIYCLYEGDEDKFFFNSKLKQISNIEFASYSMDGKDGVLEAYKYAEQNEYDLKQIMFVIDKDFDQENLDNEIYQLPVYSLENLFCDDKVIENYLKDILKIENIELIQDVLRNFQDRNVEFNLIIRELNIRIYLTNQIAEKERGYEDSDKTSLVSTKGICISDLINVNLNSVTSNEKYQELLGKYTYISQSDVKNYYNDAKFDLNFANQNYRGKFQIYFLKRYLQEVIKDSSLGSKRANQRKLFDRNYGGGQIITEDNLLIVLSNFVKVPSCFKDYIKDYENYKVS